MRRHSTVASTVAATVAATVAVLVAVAALGAVAGCLRSTAYPCADDPQCVVGGAGRCEPEGFCSFPDSTCGSGWRFGAGGGVFAEQCVGDVAGADASGGDGATLDGPRADASDVDAGPPADAAPCVRLVINEIVIWAQQDWDDTAGGDGIPFNAVPGTGPIGNDRDEWVELFNAGCEVDLTGYTISFVDGTPNTVALATPGAQVLVFSAGSSLTQFAAGGYLVIGNPGIGGTSTQVTADVWIHLDDPLGGIADDVALGGSTGGDGTSANNAPSGQSTTIADEAVARIPNGVDTNQDNLDWQRAQATIGVAN